VQDHAADQLHVEMALPERAFRGLAHGGEGGDQNVIEGFAVGKLLLELVGARRSASSERDSSSFSSALMASTRGR